MAQINEFLSLIDFESMRKYCLANGKTVHYAKGGGRTLYVPYGCSEAYKASEKWGKFKIEEMPEDKWWEMIP